MLGRHFVGIEREQSYIDAASARIAGVRRLDGAELKQLQPKRSAPRVAFLSLLESGLVKPGMTLTDHKKRWNATVRADGTLSSGPHEGSIHRTGALVQGFEACNGWTFWHFEKDGRLHPIDALREEIRTAMAAAEG